MPESDALPATSRWIWLGLLVFATLVRGGVLMARYTGLDEDPDAYRQLAVHLVHDGVYGFPEEAAEKTEAIMRPTAFRPPLYPILLALTGWTSDVSSGSVAVLHLLLGVATVLITWRLALCWGLGAWSPLPAVLVACDPILLNQSTLVMTETLATFGAVLAMWLLTRAGDNDRWPAAAAAGAAMALAALCRPTFLIWLAGSFCVLAISPSPGRWKRATAVVLGACLVLTPWTVRNLAVFGRPIVATTHGGYTLLLGNNDGFYEFLRQSHFGSVWDSTELDAEVNRTKTSFDGDELATDRWAYGRAKSTIRENPTTFAYACAVRIGRLWRPAPHRLSVDESASRRTARYAVGLWYLIAFTLALWGCWRLNARIVQKPWIWGLLLCLAFTLLHTFYWSNLRMRAPLMPVVYLAVVLGLQKGRRRT